MPSFSFVASAANTHLPSTMDSHMVKCRLRRCIGLSSIQISSPLTQISWHAHAMLDECGAMSLARFHNADISAWDASKVTSMWCMSTRVRRVSTPTSVFGTHQKSRRESACSQIAHHELPWSPKTNSRDFDFPSGCVR